MVEVVAVAADVIHKLGHVSTLPSEHHCSGSVVDARDGRAHWTRQRRVRAEDGDGVVDVRRVSHPHKLRHALRRAEEAGGAAPRSLGWPKKTRMRRAERAKPFIKRTRVERSDEPFIADALGLEGVSRPFDLCISRRLAVWAATCHT